MKKNLTILVVFILLLHQIISYIRSSSSFALLRASFDARTQITTFVLSYLLGTPLYSLSSQTATTSSSAHSNFLKPVCPADLVDNKSECQLSDFIRQKPIKIVQVHKSNLKNCHLHPCCPLTKTSGRHFRTDFATT